MLFTFNIFILNYQYKFPINLLACFSEICGPDLFKNLLFVHPTVFPNEVVRDAFLDDRVHTSSDIVANL